MLTQGLIAATALAATTAALRGRRVQVRSARVLCIGVAVFVVAAVGPLAGWAQRSGLAMHVLQHLLIFSVAATFVVAAVGERSRDLSARSMRGGAAAGCLLAGAGMFWILHSAPLLRLSETAAPTNDLQHVLLLGAGVLVALPLAGARPLGGFAAAVYLVITEIAIGALGIVLAWSPGLLYPGVVFGANPWDLAPGTDQALAGAFILVLEEPLLAAEFAVAFIAGLTQAERRQRLEEAAEDAG